MSFEAKALFLREMEDKLSAIVTAADMGKILSALSDQMARYEVERIAAEDGPDDLMDAYVAAMQIQGRSAKTIARYTYILNRMMEHVKVPTRSITVYHLRQYLASEKSRGIADRTLEGIRQIFSAYFNWLQREKLIESNPTANLGAIKCQKKAKSTYSDVDLEKLKFGCKSIRDRAIVAFLMSTGCRISEMVSLNREDVDLTNLECTVLGKGNKQRAVYLDPVAGMLIRQYLNERTDKDPALFIGRRGKRLTAQGIRKMLSGLSEETGVEHVHPHKFRRTMATNLIRHGMPIQEVAMILGHDKLDTTMEYVVLDNTEVKNAYRKFA